MTNIAELLLQHASGNNIRLRTARPLQAVPALFRPIAAVGALLRGDEAESGSKSGRSPMLVLYVDPGTEYKRGLEFVTRELEARRDVSAVVLEHKRASTLLRVVTGTFAPGGLEILRIAASDRLDGHVCVLLGRAAEARAAMLEDLNALRMSEFLASLSTQRCSTLQADLDETRRTLDALKNTTTAAQDDAAGRIAKRIAQLEAQLEDALRAVDRYERSHSWRLGRAIVEAYEERKPAALLRVPGRILAATRKIPKQTISPTAAGTASGFGPFARPDPMLGAYLAPVLHRELRAAVVASPKRVQFLSRALEVAALTPNDYPTVLTNFVPDVLIVSSDADDPLSPWQYVGTPYGAERNSQLFDLIQLARARGVPTLLWYTRPYHEHPVLHSFEACCGRVYVADRNDARELSLPVLPQMEHLASFQEQLLERSSIVFLVGGPAEAVRVSAWLSAARKLGPVRLYVGAGMGALPAEAAADTVRPLFEAFEEDDAPVQPLIVIADARSTPGVGFAARRGLARGGRLATLDGAACPDDLREHVVHLDLAGRPEEQLRAALASTPTLATAFRTHCRLWESIDARRVLGGVCREALRLPPVGLEVSLLADASQPADVTRLAEFLVAQTTLPGEVILTTPSIRAELHAALQAIRELGVSVELMERKSLSSCLAQARFDLIWRFADGPSAGSDVLVRLVSGHLAVASDASCLAAVDVPTPASELPAGHRLLSREVGMRVPAAVLNTAAPFAAPAMVRTWLIPQNG